MNIKVLSTLMNHEDKTNKTILPAEALRLTKNKNCIYCKWLGAHGGVLDSTCVKGTVKHTEGSAS